MRWQITGCLALAFLAGAASTAYAQQPSAGGQAAANASSAKPAVSGTFKGNGKDAKIAFVSVQWREPFNDKPGIRLIFTEKDHTRDPKADFNASFGRYGSALVISLFENGDIFGCEVSHSAHRGGFSAIGKIKTKDFKIENGIVQGQLTTNGPDDVFGQTWEVDLKFSAPLSGSPPKAEPAPASPPKTARQPAAKSSDAAAPASPALAALNVKELPIPADATDVEFKKLVQHIGFKSPGDYKAVAADLVKKLAAQGWKIEGADRVAANPKIPPKSYILNAARGEATLTVFVKPAETGCQVTIFSKGLAWGEP